MSTFHLSVCPHDTANNPERWYIFVQYLAQQLSVSIQFDISLDFQDFHASLSTADLVYANPTDTMYLIEQKGFLPIARPADMYDEVVFVASHAIDNPTLESIQGNSLASVTSLLPTKIALHILHKRSITPSEVADRESWLSVMGSIWRDEASFGVIYKDTYDELSDQGRGMAKALWTSNEKVAFHSFVLGPKLADRKAEVEQLLLGMHADEKGKNVLQELHLTKWLGIQQSELDTMKRIIETY